MHTLNDMNHEELGLNPRQFIVDDGHDSNNYGMELSNGQSGHVNNNSNNNNNTGSVNNYLESEFYNNQGLLQEHKYQPQNNNNYNKYVNRGHRYTPGKFYILNLTGFTNYLT